MIRLFILEKVCIIILQEEVVVSFIGSLVKQLRLDLYLQSLFEDLAYPILLLINVYQDVLKQVFLILLFHSLIFWVIAWS